MAANRRIYYAIQQLQVAPDGTAVGAYATSHVVKGLQSLGLNTRFNLEQIFEIGQLAIYQNVEGLPDIEVSCEKLLDGNKLLYHLATPTATSPTLAGRSAIKCQLLMSIYADTLSSASGTPLSEVEMSGMFISQVGYNFQINGPFSESVSFTGSNKTWRSAAFGASGGFSSNTDTPLASSGVQLRQHIVFGQGLGAAYPYSGATLLPPSVRGITDMGGGTGCNIESASSGCFGASIQSIKVSCSNGRDALLELGRKAAYFRPLQFPVQVKTDIEIYAKEGDYVNAVEGSDSNTAASKIRICVGDGTTIDCGKQNRLESVQYGNANAGKNSSNATITYSYVTYNDFSVTHPQDPAGLSTVYS